MDSLHREVTLRVRFDGWLGGLISLLSGGLTVRSMELEASGLKARAEAAR